MIAVEERRRVSTQRAMEALTDIADQLDERRDTLTPLEWRTYAWARSSLAVLSAIRVEESLSELNPDDLPRSS